jgi:amino acid adenylation domain-containing protein
MPDRTKAELSSSERSRLENYLRNKVQEGAKAAPSIPRRNTQQTIPLTPAQEQIWVHAQLAPDLPLYNEPVTIHYSGRMDYAAFERAFNEILRRHESWRTAFTTLDERPVQIIHPARNVSIPVIDLRDLPESEREAESVRIATADAVVPLDFTMTPLFRARLIQLDDEHHRLYLTLSHIIFDGVAIYRVFVPELAALYKAFAAGLASPLPNLPFQYPDFACWKNRNHQTARRAADMAYWRQQLAGDLPILNLPVDRPRPAVQSFRGSMYPWVIDADLMSALKVLSQSQGVTLFQTLLAAFAVLLQRYSGEDDIPIGSVTSGRDVPGTERLLGYFLNTVILRLNFSEDITFVELLVRARNVTLEALAHDSISPAELLNELGIRRDSSYNPLFQSMFTLEPPIPALEPGWQLTQMDVDTGATKYDIYLELDERHNGILARFHYSTDLFDRASIVRMAEQWTALLEAVVASPGKRLFELSDVPSDQYETSNDTAMDYPQNSTAHQLIEAQATRTPDRVAVRFEGTSTTYAELNARANQLAAHLLRQGVKREELVGLYVERSIDMLVGMLGILKAGGGYVPLDPTYPKDRIEYMLRDSKTRFVVTQSVLVDELPAHDTQIVRIDADLVKDSADNLDLPVDTSGVAYVIYTSGSTGKPKGVRVPHRAVVNFLTSMASQPGICADDILLAVTTPSFDIAVLELFLPLIVGAKIVISHRETAADGEALRQALEREEATMMQATPTTWRQLLGAGWKGNRTFKILCGGEAFPQDLVADLLARSGSLWNMYGPTETTVWSTCYRVTDATAPVLIGKPIGNTQCYVLNSKLRPVSAGVIGELYIGGDGVATGYLDRPELTESRFVPNPFKPGTRMYKTGDLVRYRPDGNIECLGRNDYQVKLRGNRIELGEIESILSTHPSIEQAVTIIRQDHDSGAREARLVAYLIFRKGEELSQIELRKHLRMQLPDYTIPQLFVRLEAFPMTENGKIDRKRLPKPPSVETAEDFIAPRTDAERLIAEIWREVLGTRQIGVYDNFFNLGGNSLLSLQMIARIEKRTGYRMNPRLVLLDTLEQLATLLPANKPIARGLLSKLKELLAGG